MTIFNVVRRSPSLLACGTMSNALSSPHRLAESLGLIGVRSGATNLSETVDCRVKQKLRAEHTRRR